MSRTAVIIIVGVVLLALFLGAGYLVKAIAVRIWTGGAGHAR